MKFKKLAVLGTFAAVASISLASCNPAAATTTTTGGGATTTTTTQQAPATTTTTTQQGGATTTTTTQQGGATTTTTTQQAPATTTTTQQGGATTGAASDHVLDIHINYRKQAGVTLRESSFMNTVENKNYVQGDLLPVWKSFAEKVGVTIKDASAYSTDDDTTSYNNLTTSKFESETEAGRKIDLFYNTTSNINKAGAAGNAINLLDHLDVMPNFKAYLESNPTIKTVLQQSGKIFYTPYFDGYNNIERMFVVDTNLVKTVLDQVVADKDTVKTQGANARGIAKVAYQPFMDANYNYKDATTTVKVSKNKTLQDLTIKQTANIIKQQNEAMTSATGASGADLRAQFRAYLDAAFEGQIGEGKLYPNYSDIFVSESAAYNTDELIALMRVIKASSELISGDPETEIEILCPRGQDKGRVQNILQAMKIFGIQGLDGEKENLYYDADGKINDAASTKASYEALTYLSQLYDEGLILGDFYKTAGTNSGTAYTAKYFGKTAANPGYGFMLYDFCATQAQMNSKDEDGVGTADSTRKDTFANQPVTGIMPILSPLTYWATEKGANAKTDALSNRTHKTLIRYEESNRALKSNAWMIPATSDNVEDACKLMDFLFSREGQIINDFGPSEYWEEGKIDSFNYLTETTPKFSAAMKNLISTSGKDFWTTLRNYLGATHGIGYVRTATINYLATNKYGKIGQVNIDNSIASGATVLCMVDKHATPSFDSSVPSAGYASIGAETAKNYDSITSFWASDKLQSDAYGWVAYVVADASTISNSLACGTTTNTKVAYTYGDVQNEIQSRIDDYLYAMADSWDAVPDYII